MFCFSYSVTLLSDFVEKVSLFKYVQPEEIPKEEILPAACESLKENTPECITVEEIESVQKSLEVDKLQNKKRFVFGEKEKQEIAKFASEHGHAAAVRKFKKKLQTVTESTIRPWVKRYKENLKEKRKANKEVVGCRARFEATGYDHIP